MKNESLFSGAARERLQNQAPLAARLRPRNFDEVVGQQKLVAVGAPFRKMVENDTLRSVILWGPPGTGKTTLAEVVARVSSRHFERVSAVTSGVKDLREVIEAARDRLGTQGQRTIVFVDEIHRFNKAQQDALLPSVEEGLITLIGATTENPFFEVNAPLRSRSTLFRLEPLARQDIETLVMRGVAAEGMDAEPEATQLIAERCIGDGRQALTAVEVACALARPNSVELQHAEAALSTSALRYGRDDHYDVVSAFIKSMRGSDPNAAVYWLARMLEAGEDPRFIARRMIIAASEDVGMADPSALTVAVAAAQALDVVGLPEAQLNLAQAAVHIARAPKSNAVAMAIWTAREDVRNGRVAEVPAHLRDSHYQGATQLGHGVDYVSPHNDPSGSKSQKYLPDSMDGIHYFDNT
jgi:putative ATPase